MPQINEQAGFLSKTWSWWWRESLARSPLFSAQRSLSSLIIHVSVSFHLISECNASGLCVTARNRLWGFEKKKEQCLLPVQ